MARIIRAIWNQTQSSIEKTNNLKRALDQNRWDGKLGWLWGPLFTVFRTDAIRGGKLVGTDKYGNRYFEDKSFFIGRSRYVIYKEELFMNFDSSQVPPEWHGWLHYMTDKTPIEEPPTERKWMADHTENFTGTNKQKVYKGKQEHSQGLYKKCIGSTRVTVNILPGDMQFWNSGENCLPKENHRPSASELINFLTLGSDYREIHYEYLLSMDLFRVDR